MILDFLLTHFYDYTFMILYVSNLILVFIAYKLGFAKKLPLLKNIVVYFLLAIGTVLLALFGGIARLPITESLIIIVLVLGIYRLRLHRERKARQST